MNSNKTSISIAVRSFLIALSSALLGFFTILLFEKQLFFIPFQILIIIAIQIFELVKFIQNSNQLIFEYIDVLHQAENTIFKRKVNKNNLDNIRESIDSLMQIVHTSKFEKEVQKQYLQLIINSIKIGLISYNQENEIVLINNTAKTFFRTEKLKSLNDIENTYPEFLEEVKSIENRNSKLINIKTGSDLINLTISKSVFKVENELITNITFQDIRNEIVQNEIESWRRLIKVLRHEILNSITPISTLTDTIISIINKESGIKKSIKELTEEDIEDINDSMKSIKTRSNGLFDFVNIYRQIDKIPNPKFENIPVKEILKSIVPLFSKELHDKNIELKISEINAEFYIYADFSLVQQVIINLIKNSIEALDTTKSPIIQIIADKTESSISIIDNGVGIPLNQIDQIFIPLFTTKEKGSGIGLFLSRQIMQLHHGNITVKSVPDEETDFTLHFSS